MNAPNSRHLIKTAIAGLLAAAPLATMADNITSPTGTEPCYGVAQAGKNDCATAKHACAGSAATNGSPEDFKFVATGTCEKLGGKLKPATAK